MFDRVLAIKAVLYPLKDAKRRTDDKDWAFQLIKVELGSNETYREQWFFRHTAPHPSLKDKYQLTLAKLAEHASRRRRGCASAAPPPWRGQWS